MKCTQFESAIFEYTKKCRSTLYFSRIRTVGKWLLNHEEDLLQGGLKLKLFIITRIVGKMSINLLINLNKKLGKKKSSEERGKTNQEIVV